MVVVQNFDVMSDKFNVDSICTQARSTFTKCDYNSNNNDNNL